jgi:hypothetical protein
VTPVRCVFCCTHGTISSALDNVWALHAVHGINPFSSVEANVCSAKDVGQANAMRWPAVLIAGTVECDDA